MAVLDILRKKKESSTLNAQSSSADQGFSSRNPFLNTNPNFPSYNPSAPQYNLPSGRSSSGSGNSGRSSGGGSSSLRDIAPTVETPSSSVAQDLSPRKPQVQAETQTSSVSELIPPQKSYIDTLTPNKNSFFEPLNNARQGVVYSVDYVSEASSDALFSFKNNKQEGVYLPASFNPNAPYKQEFLTKVYKGEAKLSEPPKSGFALFREEISGFGEGLRQKTSFLNPIREFNQKSGKGGGKEMPFYTPNQDWIRKPANFIATDIVPLTGFTEQKQIEMSGKIMSGEIKPLFNPISPIGSLKQRALFAAAPLAPAVEEFTTAGAVFGSIAPGFKSRELWLKFQADTGRALASQSIRVTGQELVKDSSGSYLKIYGERSIGTAKQSVNFDMVMLENIKKSDLKLIDSGNPIAKIGFVDSKLDIPIVNIRTESGNILTGFVKRGRSSSKITVDDGLVSETTIINQRFGGGAKVTNIVKGFKIVGKDTTGKEFIQKIKFDNEIFLKSLGEPEVKLVGRRYFKNKGFDNALGLAEYNTNPKDLSAGKIVLDKVLDNQKLLDVYFHERGHISEYAMFKGGNWNKITQSMSSEVYEGAGKEVLKFKPFYNKLGYKGSSINREIIADLNTFYTTGGEATLGYGRSVIVKGREISFKSIAGNSIAEFENKFPNISKIFNAYRKQPEFKLPSQDIVKAQFSGKESINRAVMGDIVVKQERTILNYPDVDVGIGSGYSIIEGGTQTTTIRNVLGGSKSLGVRQLSPQEGFTSFKLFGMSQETETGYNVAAGSPSKMRSFVGKLRMYGGIKAYGIIDKAPIIKIEETFVSFKGRGSGGNSFGVQSSDGTMLKMEQALIGKQSPIISASYAQGVSNAALSKINIPVSSFSASTSYYAGLGTYERSSGGLMPGIINQEPRLKTMPDFNIKPLTNFIQAPTVNILEGLGTGTRSRQRDKMGSDTIQLNLVTPRFGQPQAQSFRQDQMYKQTMMQLEPSRPFFPNFDLNWNYRSNQFKIPPIAPPGFFFSESPRGRAKGSRTLFRTPSLAALNLGLTASKATDLEFTGLFERPVLTRTKRRRKKR